MEKSIKFVLLISFFIESKNKFFLKKNQYCSFIHIIYIHNMSAYILCDKRQRQNLVICRLDIIKLAKINHRTKEKKITIIYINKGRKKVNWCHLTLSSLWWCPIKGTLSYYQQVMICEAAFYTY